MRRTALLALAAAAAALAGCSSADSGQQLDVSAAASLTRAFGSYAAHLPGEHVRYSFAGSDALAAQIEAGLHPDVYASADLQLAQRLYAKGLLERPVTFASNRLVIAVPRASAVHSLAQLERPGTTIALGSASVPVGVYAGKLLSRLPAPARARLLANVRDREPDVTGIIGKLTQGAVDAGLVYATDVAAAQGQLRAIALPGALSPPVAYAAGVVAGSPHPALAAAFVAGLVRGAGHTALMRAGFGAPPP